MWYPLDVPSRAASVGHVHSTIQALGGALRAWPSGTSPVGYATPLNMPGADSSFTLTETGGRSGATIQNIQSTVDNGNSDNTGVGCWRERIRVEPGGSLATFDAGWDSLGDRAPSAGSSTPSSRVKVAVTYTDDDGRTGTIDAVALVTR